MATFYTYFDYWKLAYIRIVIRNQGFHPAYKNRKSNIQRNILEVVMTGFRFKSGLRIFHKVVQQEKSLSGWVENKCHALRYEKGKEAKKCGEKNAANEHASKHEHDLP